ncbi:hypothetical protein C8R42DRAFT_686250 [Lentinula raphanica]|nr:hypothetical protein C8R42DRAFT_686250 [Lentinula raphanica]
MCIQRRTMSHTYSEDSSNYGNPLDPTNLSQTVRETHPPCCTPCSLTAILFPFVLPFWSPYTLLSVSLNLTQSNPSHPTTRSPIHGPTQSNSISP